jgi:hypothetical protein
MKKRIITMLTVCILISSIAYAKRVAWKKTATPPVRLAEAIKLAKASIPMRTDMDYYCINASLAKTFSEADWQLHFSSAEGKEVWVSVGSDKKTRTSWDGFEY